MPSSESELAQALAGVPMYAPGISFGMLYPAYREAALTAHADAAMYYQRRHAAPPVAEGSRVTQDVLIDAPATATAQSVALAASVYAAALLFVSAPAQTPCNAVADRHARAFARSLNTPPSPVEASSLAARTAWERSRAADAIAGSSDTTIDFIEYCCETLRNDDLWRGRLDDGQRPGLHRLSSICRSLLDGQPRVGPERFILSWLAAQSDRALLRMSGRRRVIPASYLNLPFSDYAIGSFGTEMHELPDDAACEAAEAFSIGHYFAADVLADLSTQSLQVQSQASLRRAAGVAEWRGHAMLTIASALQPARGGFDAARGDPNHDGAPAPAP